MSLRQTFRNLPLPGISGMRPTVSRGLGNYNIRFALSSRLRQTVVPSKLRNPLIILNGSTTQRPKLDTADVLIAALGIALGANFVWKASLNAEADPSHATEIIGMYSLYLFRGRLLLL